MNQILSTEGTKKTEKLRYPGKPVAVEKIVRFFAIVIIIFGVLMLCSGSYSMYTSSKAKSTNNKPEIFVGDTSEKTITLQVTHNVGLEKVNYNWNNEAPIEITTNRNKKVEKVIEIPTGENILNVYAVDIYGKESRYQKQYTLLGDISIQIEAEGTNIKISVTGKEEISYITYRWDEDEETKINVNNTQTEQTIETPKGSHTLTVIAVDVNNKTETKKKDVKGVTKPKLDVTTDGSDNFVIKASDEEGIKRVEFIINETERKSLDLDKVRSLDERKEFEYAYPLHDGENKLEIRVYNESGISEVKRVVVNK